MGAKAQFSRLGRSGFGRDDAESTRTGQTLKINLQNVAYFSTSGNDHENHHVYHAFHHTFTIKKPRFAPGFLQNPLQKHTFASN
jgi:hypothetical protein